VWIQAFNRHHRLAVPVPVQVVRSLRFDGTKIPEGYERQVQRALWTFRHQVCAYACTACLPAGSPGMMGACYEGVTCP
jgi:hypothetical protein